ncbi:efflux RND transporter periplasmic adaptor subunit [Variovorax ginsengisoli]|uniref:Efflux RND transporter periplasmic adaptor subunit n=1 Tax=Variovorax ginsengisoli TaxID=363844 RepID=A0ABT8S6P7_9BURK|nr:efflux RND transporter periplasmic adaptor subunit [Variovorax ginsengisoli]MDN8615429.1 efflux RND transporter periplasmic adaptor subunit [Variovorax ginsengisoli]MDO1534599.1 efflux RND transporter periplasmic adaptor subunit [Variovorax ginsengisoli]
MSSPIPEPATDHLPAIRPVPSRRRRWLGSLVALALVLGLAVGGWYLIKRSGEPAGGRPNFGGASSTVGHAAARRMQMPIVIDALGTVTPLATITLKPQVGGVLTEVLYTEGQSVAKGQLLARIDPRPYEQALMQAQGTRVRDEAQLEAARVTLSRYRTLLTQDSIARQDVDTQAALVKQLEGAVITDRAAEAAAKLNLDYTRITAPVAGRIGLRTVDPGNNVAANASTGIAVITQMNPIDVQFAVPQDRVPDIQAQLAKGEALQVKALDRVRSAVLDTGVFSTLDNVVDTSTGTVRAKARFANNGTPLFPNQFVNVQMVLRTVDALVVPVTAVRIGPNGNFVYVVNEDRTVSVRNVKRGDATVDVVAILDGLTAGEDVVTEGGDRLKDGARVALQGDKPATAPRPGASGPRGPRAPGSPGGEGRRQRPPQ